jgi:hypothetical protein
MLFRSVEQLSRLSLREGLTREASVHAAEDYSTPDSLSNSYMVVKLEDKINVLYSFLKTHLAQKTIVFMATCRQVCSTCFRTFDQREKNADFHLCYSKQNEIGECRRGSVVSGQLRSIDYRCEYGYFPVSFSCVSISNPDSL